MASLPDIFGVKPEDIKKLTPAKQREWRELLQAGRKILERNPLEAWFPHDKQKQFLSAPERTRAFYAGNRTGKSECGCVDDLIQALPQELVPKHLLQYKRYGWDEPFKGRVITPDLAHTMDAIVEKFNAMTPREALKNGEWESAFSKRDRVLHFVNGSVIDFMSFEQKPDKFGGVDLHQVHFDEEPNGPNSYKIWRDSRARLIDHGGREIFTMTPLHGEVWVSEMLWERREAEGVFVIQAKMSDNPYLSPKEILDFAAGLPEDERRAVIDGEPVAFEGRFFEEFDTDKHVVEDLNPAGVQASFESIVLGLDPSLTRTGVVWVGFDAENRATVFDEFVPPARTLPKQVVAEIRTRNAYWGISPDYCVIDPAARAGATVNAEAVEDFYLREGLPTVHGQAQRGPGILEVKRRLHHDSLKVAKRCRTLIWEFPRYRRDASKTSDEYAAVKKDDDLLDALRYVLMSRPWAVSAPPSETEFDWTTGQAPPASWFNQPRAEDNPLGALI